MAGDSIVKLIADAVNDQLLLDMEVLVDASDLTRAGVVREGLLQDSPTKGGINILTWFNDPDNPDGWRHSVLEATPTNSLGVHVPPYEIGGGAFWWRRYVTILQQFFKAGVTRASAEDLASTVLSRAEQSILRVSLPQDMDAFGEVALQTYLHSSTNIEGGGTGQFIFNGKIWWQCLCEKTR